MTTLICMAVVTVTGGLVALACKLRSGWLGLVSFVVFAGTAIFLVLKHGAWPMVPPVLFWLAVAFAWWAFIPRTTLPLNRVRRQNIRLRLKLHPGRGQATIWELHRHWGRLASGRKARYSRPQLTWFGRVMLPNEHSVLLGRAHYRHAVRLPIEEHALVFAPPRTGKTGWLSTAILHYPGPVLSTTTRADVYKQTVRARAAVGQVDMFNPQRIGGVPSTMRFDVLRGCEDPAVAIRRADAFAAAVSSKGMEGGEFWAQKCSDTLRGLFFAAAYARQHGVLVGLPTVARWALTDSSREAEEILVETGAHDWAAQLAELHSVAEKTSATIRMYLSHALGFMLDPMLAEAVTADPDDPGLDLESFARGHSTLYMVANGQNEDSPLAPLFACIASEIHYVAGLVGSMTASGRLPNPLLFGLDEVTQICPVPLPAWLADSGGKNIQIVAVAHGMSQLRKRWGDDSAQTILDTVGSQIVLPGIKDAKVLKDISDACGTVAMRERGQHHLTQHPVMDTAMIRQLPDTHALVIRGNRPPVMCKVRQIWGDRLYRKLARLPMPWQDSKHRTVAPPVATSLDTRELETVTAVPAAPADARAEAYSWTSGVR